MNALFTRASVKRSPRTRTRKASVSECACPPSPSRSSSIVTHNDGASIPLQIIPELSENDLELDSETPYHCISILNQSPRPSPRVTLSAFPFSIDDALLMFNDEPRSPALSASSSTEGSNLSEELPTTPGASDDEDFYELRLPSPRLRPHHVEIRPLCITKTRSIVCAEHENVPNIIDGDANPHNSTVELYETQEAREEQESDYDFYARQFQDFLSVSSTCVQVPATAARPESIILSTEDAPKLLEEQPKPRGRSRFSKPLPHLPLTVPPSSTLPAVPNSVSATLKCDASLIHAYPSLPPPVQRRPPRMSVPCDIGESDPFEEEPLSLVEQIWSDDDDEEFTCSRPSSTLPYNSIVPLSPALPETPMNEIYLPRASTDSDVPRSSLDSSIYHSLPSSESTPVANFSCTPAPTEDSHQLRSRWSSSTLNSLDVEPSRTAAILNPLRNVFGSKPRRARPVPLNFIPSPTLAPVHSKMPLARMIFSAMPSPPSTPSRRVRRQNSRSSTSSLASSECESCDSGNSSRGLRRKPIPVEMFLRA